MKRNIFIRFSVTGASALGLATVANWTNHNSYWNGAIAHVQTTDFNNFVPYAAN
jgi:hypothetical protein